MNSGFLPGPKACTDTCDRSAKWDTALKAGQTAPCFIRCQGGGSVTDPNVALNQSGQPPACCKFRASVLTERRPSPVVVQHLARVALIPLGCLVRSGTGTSGWSPPEAGCLARVRRRWQAVQPRPVPPSVEVPLPHCVVRLPRGKRQLIHARVRPCRKVARR